MGSTADWSPASWRSKPIKQVVTYDDQAAVSVALSKLSSLPPIVTPSEIVKLKSSLRDAALGKSFLLQGGDCAELFSYCADDPINAKIKLLLQMSLVLIWGSNKPVIRIGRMAGQYAKPRSSPTEIVDGKEMPSFRGDILNGFDPAHRHVDPDRLVTAYFHSATTLNYIRGQLSSGIADLHNPLDWDLGHVQDQGLQEKYSRIVSNISESLRFMRTIGADTSGKLQTVDLYTSHEGLVLEYEQSLTRRLKHPVGYKSGQSSDGKGWYNTSAHFIWIGDRTRQIDGGHVEYFRGIENPIGIKVGPSMKNDELVELLDIVNPDKEVGKVTLITRYGKDKVESMLGPHIEAVKSSGHVVVWQCDPMHGTPTGIKTRSFNSIFSELSSALKIHKQHGSFLGGMHLELTGDAVTECTGGSEGLAEEDLSLNYTTYCDPRLNEKQALELAFLVAGHYREDSALMGSSASKGARAAGASVRKYPSRPAPSTMRPPVSATPPSHSTDIGSTVHPPPQTSESKTQAIDLDARDPAFASRLSSMGVVQPNPHYSPSSTSSFDPQRHTSSEFPSDMMTELPQSAFPDPRDNPVLRLLEARQRIQEEADQELENVGRRDFQGRKYVDAGVITLALMRRQRGEPEARIEEALGIKRGRLSALKEGIVSSI
ncbi:Aromatic/aminoadipate aminotransferase 1 [Kalmusia sp. IMI 367209]|nr:Aromatic/aminoadipate aminotransferase 1 [Kalmusia sp. IMI 367209]